MRAVCAEFFPDNLKDLTRVCPAMSVMKQPPNVDFNTLYYGFDIANGKNFYAVVALDIQVKLYGFDIVRVKPCSFKMVDDAKLSNPGNLERFERERATRVYEANLLILEKNKAHRLQSAIKKKPKLGKLAA